MYIFVTRFLARERVTKESEKFKFIILHRFSNYQFLSSKKDPTLTFTMHRQQQRQCSNQQYL